MTLRGETPVPALYVVKPSEQASISQFLCYGLNAITIPGSKRDSELGLCHSRH